MTYVTYFFLFGSFSIFIVTAIQDFMTWKISNNMVLAAIATYVPFAATGFFANPELAAKVDPVGAVVAAVALFTIGFVLWLMKMLGAGDAKLMFPVGLFVGWNYLLPFALGLIIFAVFALLVIKLPLPAGIGSTRIGGRLLEIRRSGKIPYGVIMVAALLVTLYAKYLA